MPPLPDPLGAGIFTPPDSPLDLPGLLDKAPSRSRTGANAAGPRSSVAAAAAARPGGPSPVVVPAWAVIHGIVRGLDQAVVAVRPAPPDHGGAGQRSARPRPAPPAAHSQVTVPPAGALGTGGGFAAAAAGTGGGGAAVSLMAAATLLLLFTLSIPVSLDLSAWRSTLLSLRLERPG
jgi:hypothetical protein